MLCFQCGAPAERCPRCGSALCTRLLCAELHEVSCAAISTLPRPAPLPEPTRAVFFAPKPAPRPVRDAHMERTMVEQLLARIDHHRRAGRHALAAGDLDLAFDELFSARDLEPDLDRLGAVARQALPHDWELETDIVPLARALSSSQHIRSAETWSRVLDDGAARSIQVEAAEWLARNAFAAGHPRVGLRVLHAASTLGRPADPTAFHAAYKQAGLDPDGMFALYLVASRTDPPSARASRLLDPLTECTWVDQDPRWWQPQDAPTVRFCLEHHADHQAEALHRARDLARTRRDEGWFHLAEGDLTAGPLGVRTLGRNVRAGCAEPAEHDAFVHVRLAYEAAAERLPDVAWPCYRLAELLAWGGFADRALAQLTLAEERSLGPRDEDRRQRPLLRALVQAGLGIGPDGLATAARPHPRQPFGTGFTWPWRLRAR